MVDRNDAHTPPAGTEEGRESPEQQNGDEAAPRNEGAVSDEESLMAAMQADLESMRQDVERLEKERDQLKNVAARHKADLYNYRKRVERESARQKELAGEQAVRKLLPVMDNLDRAIAAAQEGESLLKGVSMVRQQFRQVLAELGATQISGEGKFDPGVHEAVSSVAVDDPERDHAVLEVVQPGYRLGDRVIRAAKVVVGTYEGDTETAEGECE
ncbi:MAG: nucleotide exchange factor GrpE [Synergistales bacterium]|nr:nucleotide exchange factor GrpE [Synergistales bacterium]